MVQFVSTLLLQHRPPRHKLLTQSVLMLQIPPVSDLHTCEMHDSTAKSQSKSESQDCPRSARSATSVAGTIDSRAACCVSARTSRRVVAVCKACSPVSGLRLSAATERYALLGDGQSIVERRNFATVP